MAVWKKYYKAFSEITDKVDLPFIPEYAKHNAHMFYIKTKDLEERTRLIDFMKKKDVLAVFHYVPLHSAPAGRKFGRFHGEDVYTTKESERLARLPMFYGLKEEQVRCIADKVTEFYR